MASALVTSAGASLVTTGGNQLVTAEDVAVVAPVLLNDAEVFYAVTVVGGTTPAGARYVSFSI